MTTMTATIITDHTWTPVTGFPTGAGTTFNLTTATGPTTDIECHAFAGDRLVFTLTVAVTDHPATTPAVEAAVADLAGTLAAIGNVTRLEFPARPDLNLSLEPAVANS